MPRSHRYIVTLDGLQIASFYTTLYRHVLRPGWATLTEPTLHTPAPLDTAVRHLADVTRHLFQQIHSYPDHSDAAA